MSDVQRYFLTVDSNKEEAADIALDVARRIQGQDTKLIDVVQSLGEYLTDDDATVRARAVAYLAAVLGALEPHFLTRQQIDVNIQFFCDRIEDASGLKEAATGLAALQKARRFSSDNAVQLATTLFANAQDLQRHPQGTRFVVLTLMNNLMESHRPALKTMGEPFNAGLIDLVSGEKDPRNLMIVFSLLHVVMVEWDSGSQVEALFDSVFCYFPITFRPPPNDPYGISAQDLKLRLRDCIASNSSFATFSFPALLDKLDSTSPSVKRDVLQTLTACVKSYIPTTIAIHSTQLWDSLKQEVFHSQEEDLADEALVTIKTIAERLSAGLETLSDQTPLFKFIEPIAIESCEKLQEPQHLQAQPASRILEAVASASPLSFAITVKAVAPKLISLYRSADAISKHRALLEVWNRLIAVSMDLYGTWASQTPLPDLQNALEEYRDNLYFIYSSALMGNGAEWLSVRVTAVTGLLQMAKLRNYLRDEEVGMIVQSYNQILLNAENFGQEELKNGAIAGLTEISGFRSGLVKTITFPEFMATLPDRDVSTNREYLSSLEVLARISAKDDIFDTMLRRLLSKLVIVVQNAESPEYSRAILAASLFVLERRDIQADLKMLGNILPRPDWLKDEHLRQTNVTQIMNVPFVLYYTKLVLGLVPEAARPKPNDAGFTAYNDEASLHIMGKISNMIVRTFSAEEQELVLIHVEPPFSLRNIPLSRLYSSDGDQYACTRFMIIFAYLMAALRREIQPWSWRCGIVDLEMRPSLLVDLLLHESNEATRTALLWQLALVVNKWPHEAENEFLKFVIPNLCVPLQTNKPLKMFRPEAWDGHKFLSEADMASNALRIIFHGTKGLVLRTGKEMDMLLSSLLDLLAHPVHGLATAHGFSILLSPEASPLLTKENHCVIRALHRARLFNYCVPQLAARFRAAETEEARKMRPHYLIALAGILRYCPSELILQQINLLLPLLLQTVDAVIDEPAVKAATLDILTLTVRESPVAVEEHVGSLIARLCASATPGPLDGPGTKYSRVRLAALQCLSLFPSAFRHELLLPYKKQVVKKLLAVLDDPKRTVRKEAVECRASWLKMDEVGDDE